MLSISVCDDDTRDIERLKAVMDGWQGAGKECACRYFYGGDELLKYMDMQGGFDIYILDILMPGTDGISLGKLIRDRDKEGRIIYLSSTRDFAVESYDVGAYHYLIKPATAENLCPLLDRISHEVKDEAGAVVRIHGREGDIVMNIDDIDYVESSMRIPHYVTASGTYAGILLRRPFKEEIGFLLQDRRFRMCGASYCVNLSHIKAVNRDGILLFSGKSLILPRAPLRELRLAWTDWWLDKR